MKNKQEWLRERKSYIESLYHHSFMSQKEVAEILDLSQSAISQFMKQNNIKARIAAKRDQSGTKNHMWKGTDVSYKGAHDRIYRVRGRATQCSKCGKTEGVIDWANVSGKYYDPQDFVELCRKCHRKFDGYAHPKISFECKVCKTNFYPKLLRVKKSRNIFCSRKCMGIFSRKLDNTEELKKLYLLGKTQSQLAEYYKVSTGTIANMLKREKICKNSVDIAL